MVAAVKKPFTYSEKSEEKRERYLNTIGQIPEENRVYVDGSGINRDLKREYGRALRGVTVVKDCKRGRKFHCVTVVPGQLHDEDGVGQLASMCCPGTMNGTCFEEWCETKLLKSVEKGETVIMDRASFHEEKRLEEICEKHTVFLWYLPPYFPDLNPIEKTWANMKKELGDTGPLHKLLETAIYAYLA